MMTPAFDSTRKVYKRKRVDIMVYLLFLQIILGLKFILILLKIEVEIIPS